MRGEFVGRFVGGVMALRSTCCTDMRGESNNQDVLGRSKRHEPCTTWGLG